MKEKNVNIQNDILIQEATLLHSKVSAVIIRPRNIAIVIGIVMAFIVSSYLMF